jgi:cytochrome c-type biogenesis protein CcmF
VSREGALVINNLLLATSALAVLIGTLYPLALESLNGTKISVGAPYFNLTAVPLFAILLIFVPFGQTLAWKRGALLGVFQRLWMALGLAIVAMAVALIVVRGGPVAAPFGIGLGFWLIAGSVSEIVSRNYKKGLSLSTLVARAIGLPRSAYGTALAHIGLGITVIGISATAWGVEALSSMKQGEMLQVGPYAIRLEQMFKRNGEGYREDVARYTIVDGRNGASLGVLEPSKRIHTGREMPTTEAGIVTFGLGQLYASIDDIAADGHVSVRAYWKPLVTLIWGGALVMALGGALSLSDRRVRITAGRRHAATAPVAGAKA